MRVMRRYETYCFREMVPETGIEPVRPLSGKRRILSPLCLPISPLGPVQFLFLNPPHK